MRLKSRNTQLLYLFIVYIISVFVDIYNGYIQQIQLSETMLPLIFKGAIMVYSFKYLFKGTSASYVVYVIFGAYLVCTAYWSFCSYTIDFSIVKDLVKILYPFFVFMALLIKYKKSDVDLVLKYVMLYGVCIAASILITGFFGIAVNSYGETYGYGIKGLFKAGNDVSLSLIMCFALSMLFISKYGRWIYILYSLVLLVSCLSLGSTACILGAFVVVFCFLVQNFFFKERLSRLSKIYKSMLLFCGIPIMLIATYAIINTDAYTQNKFDIDNIMAGENRGYLRDAFYKVYSEFSLGDYLWGKGINQLYQEMGGTLFLAQGKSVEVDYMDMLGAYGCFLGGFLLLFPVYYMFRCIRIYIHSKSMLYYWLSVVLVLFVSHGIFAGHAFTSIMAMSVLVGVVSIIKTDLE